MTKEEKELRNLRILDLRNQGKSFREISEEVGIALSRVYTILNSYSDQGVLPSNEKPVEVKLDGDEERFTSFVGYERIGVNEYVHSSTGEVVRVKFVKGVDGGFGHFVRLKGDLPRVEVFRDEVVVEDKKAKLKILKEIASGKAVVGDLK